MGFAENVSKLGDLPVGGRLLIRSKKDWRLAVISRRAETRITLSVASPTGRNYRLGRVPESEIIFDGGIAILITANSSDTWRDNFSPYDRRW